MKSVIRPLILGAISRWARSCRTDNCIAVVCPPIPGENLGDQAMVLGAVAELNRRSDVPPILITSGPRFEVPLRQSDCFTLTDRHGFFCSERSFREECGLLRDLAQSRRLLVFGADVLDGHYGRSRYQRTFEAIKRAVGLGVPVRLIGFSISEDPAEEALTFLSANSEHVELYPRDPASYRRLRDAGASNLTLAADVAFLMDSSDESALPPHARAFIETNRETLVGVSLHSNFFANRENLYHYTGSFLRELTSNDSWRFLFVPHHPADLQYFARIRESFPEGLAEHCYFIDELPTAPVAKRLFGSCQHVFTSRMHVAIASLSMRTPVTCFPYYGKFEGLFEHFELSGGLIYPDQFPAEANELAGILQSRLEANELLEGTIASRLPHLIRMAQLNFSD